jgi:hypothetical protein
MQKNQKVAIARSTDVDVGSTIFGFCIIGIIWQFSQLILSGLHQDFKVIPCADLNELGALTKPRGHLETDHNFRFFRSGYLHFSFVIDCLHQRCGIFR